MEVILDNLGLVMFVIIALGVRLVQARIKAAVRRKEAPQVFASDLEPDDDDEDETERFTKPDETEALIDYARTRGASDYTVAKTARLAEEPPRFEALPGLSAGMPTDRPAEAAFPELKTSVAPAPASLPSAAIASAFPETGKGASAPRRKKDKNGGRFPSGLEKFTPLQQAVVWAEILGKPKGMM
jgi:hypothetical protein